MPHRTSRLPGARSRTSAALLAAVAATALLGAAPAASDPTGGTGGRGGARLHVVRDGAGRVRLVSSDGSGHGPDGGSGAGVHGSAVDAARAHLTRAARLFGVRARDLRAVGVTQADHRSAVRFQQTVGGVPVLGGQLVTVVDRRGRLLSVTGETARRSHGGAAPPYDVAASTAQRTARRVAAARHHLPVSALRAARPTRWLLDRSLVEPTAPGRLRPVWRVAVRGVRRPDVADDVLVDARTGQAAMTLPQVAALDRVVCDDVRTRSYRCRPGMYDRVEAGPPTGVTDADQAYDLTGATATWYATTLGVDLTALIGDDAGDGPKLRSTTNYCPPGECPLDNAFWSGEQMVYGAGYTAADDVVAHELAHGVTQHTAGLVYWYQSGALNESMSDVLGELVDQADGVGNDAPDVRWILGEDLSPQTAGVTRDMADPPRYGQPDSTTSTLYDLALDYDDNGAVHTNSGVPNKAAYLIADGTAAEPGGAFAGRSFPGIGTTRTATLYWATLQMLTPGSDFADLALALQQACANLTFTAGECATVTAAVDATGLARGAGPDVPRSVRMHGGPGEVALSWAPPATTGSSPLTSYAVAVSPAVGGDDVATLDPTADSWVLDGLTPGTDYVVRLFAVNPDGTSPAVVGRFAGSAVQVQAPASVGWRGRVVVAGRLVDSAGRGRAGQDVGLVRRDAGQRDYRVVAEERTGADGGFAFPSWVARRSGQWFVVYLGGRRVVGVQGHRTRLVVRHRVHVDRVGPLPRPGQPLVLTGTVRPVRDGQVLLQRATDTGWTTVARGGARGGRWALRWRTPTRPVDLRVRVGARPAAGLAAGTSRVLHVVPR